ncbi:MAG: hypothetical protein QOI67_1044 [Gaiellaceae bacterium]|nr:hypothetical protein [Gaiellaceae bacterium]
MIAPRDRIALPPLVERRAGGVYDHVRGLTLPLNATGAVIVDAPTPAIAAHALQVGFAVDGERALADAVCFCAELNERLLLNVSPERWSSAFALRWFTHLPFMLPARRLPRVPARRRHVDTSSLHAILVTGVRATLRFAASAAIGTFVVASIVLGGLGAFTASTTLALAAAVGGGVVLHELGHLALLRGVPTCAATRGARLSLLHRAIDRRREALVTAAGPTTALAAAATLLALPAPSATVAGLALSLHALGLTVLTADGRTLCAVR